MDSFDAWVGFIIRWAATATFVSMIVGSLAHFAFIPLESTWRRMSIAAKVAWIKIANRLDEEQTLHQVEMFVQLERKKQQREKEAGRE